MHVGKTCLALLLLSFTSACGGGDNESRSDPPPPQPSLPQFSHVSIVVLQNTGFDKVVGNPAMPYLNSLASQFGLATQYFANSTVSVANQFILTAGKNTKSEDVFRDDNIVRELAAVKMSWKSYAEDLPSVGYTGGDQYPYVKRHNPFAYFSDVLENPAQQQNLVSFTQFTSDLTSNSLPNYSFVIPNQINNAHDCPPGESGCSIDVKLATADHWLQANIAPLIDSAGFKADGLLIILFDAAGSSDETHGGGRVSVVIISPKAKRSFQSGTFFQHASTLRLMAEGLGLRSFPGNAASAPNMSEFFSGQ